MKRTVKYLAWIVVVLFGAWSVTQLLTLTDRSNVSRAERADLFQRVETQKEQIAQEQTARTLLAEQVESLGEKPVVPAAPASLSPLPPSIRYLPVQGPRGARGEQGERGEAGADGEDSTIAGPAGAAGANGADSTVPGPQGPAGADGSPGKDGKDGSPGRGIASIVCTGGLTPITFTFTYTDGTTETVTCGQLEPVEPTPTTE